MARNWTSLPGLAAETAAVILAVVAVHAGQSLGPLYPVAEEDLLASIELAARRAEADGTIARELEQAKARALAYADRPPPVAGLRRATATSMRLFDPSVTLATPVVTPTGAVLAAAGTRVNPLEHVALSYALLFFDADEPAQLRLAQRLLATEDKLHAIMVKGSVAAFRAATGARPLFDQDGALVRRLGIEEIPALVTQQGLLLSIRTFGPEGDDG